MTIPQVAIAVVALVLLSLTPRSQGASLRVPTRDTNVDDPASRADLFSYEKKQLTRQGLHRLRSDIGVLEHADLLSFDDGSQNTGRLLQSGECKEFPDTSSWPILSAWQALDKAFGGALIPTTPLAAPCFKSWSVYNTERCATIRDSFSKPYTHENDPTSTMWPLYQGRTCLPTADPNATCTLGGSPSFAVNVSTVEHVQLAVNFARNANLRLVIKNTGHCYLGKSNGAGALSVWTHNLKEIKFIPQYKDDNYSGAAMKLGAGVTVRELYDTADHHNVTAVAGICQVRRLDTLCAIAPKLTSNRL